MFQDKLAREKTTSRPNSMMHKDCINLSLNVTRKTQINLAKPNIKPRIKT